MKNKIQQQIKELASQILNEKKSFNTSDLKQKVARLYEQLTVLEYLESHIDGKAQEQRAVDSKSYREGNWFVEPKPVPKSEYNDDLAEPLMEKIKDIVAQMPKEAEQVEASLKDILPPKEFVKNDLEEFASQYQEMPVFERKEETKENAVSSEIEIKRPEDQKPKSLNDQLNQGLTIGLNDRIAFIKHLFDNSPDDYSRVLSQINSMSTFVEADAFIKGKIKPDYNHWLNKDEYVERFMTLVEKRFN